MNQDIRRLAEIFNNLELSGNITSFKIVLSKYFDGDQEILEKSLVEASEGDNRNLNKWLFNLTPDYNGIVPWIGKVKSSNGDRYTWLIGYIDRVSQSIVRNAINGAWIKIQDDILFQPKYRPPFITYLTNIVSSNWQKSQSIPVELEGVPQFGRVGMFVESTALPHNKPLTPSHHSGVNMSSDIEIFQDNFSNSENTEDLNWKMPLDSDFLMEKTEILFHRLKENCTSETINFYEENVMANATVITKLHTEIHNYGHFLGPYVFSQNTKNDSSYESIEEYRACLMTGALGDFLDLSESVVLGLPVHVFFMRYLVYGLDSFLKGKFDVVNTREMEVGALFYFLLGSKGVLVNRNHKIHLESTRVKDIFKSEVKDIHDLESKALNQENGLSQISRSYRNNLFKMGKYSISDFYKKLRT